MQLGYAQVCLCGRREGLELPVPRTAPVVRRRGVSSLYHRWRFISHCSVCWLLLEPFKRPLKMRVRICMTNVPNKLPVMKGPRVWCSRCNLRS